MAQPIIGTGSSRKKKFIIVFVVLALVIGCVAGWYFFVRDNRAAPGASPAKEPATDKALSFIPRFDDVHSVTTFADAKWYAVNGGVIRVADGQADYFSNAQGVPAGTVQDVVAHNGRLWISTQHGVAYLDKEGRAFVAENVQGTSTLLDNGRLFLDDKAGTLYVSTFEKLLRYDAKAETWAEISGPANVFSFAANDTHVALYASKPGWPIWVYDKAADKWAKNSPAIEEQSGTVIRLGTDLFLLGRTAGYTSCDMAGKVTATSAFRLNAQGAWEPLSVFNADKKRLELNILRSAGGEVRVKTSPCDGSATKTYALTYKDGAIALTSQQNVGTSQNGSLENESEQRALIAELAAATGLQPSMHVWDIDGKGNVVFSYNDAFSASSVADENYLGVAAGNQLSKAKLVAMSTLQGRYNVPILCGSGQDRALTYIFSGELNLAGSGQEGFPDGTWKSAKLYIADTSDDTKLKQVVDLVDDVAAPVFACDDEQLVWLGKTHVKQMNRTTNAVIKFGAAVGSDLRYTTTSAAMTPTGSLWFGLASLQPNAGSLYFYDNQQDAYAAVAQNITVGKLTAATDTAVVNISEQQKQQTQVVYDRKGKVMMPFDTPGAVAYAADKNAYLKLQTDPPAIPSSIFLPFSVSSYKPDTAAEKLSLTNKGFSVRYSQENPFQNLPSYPTIVYDQSRHSIWLNDALLGITILGLPK